MYLRKMIRATAIVFALTATACATTGYKEKSVELSHAKQWVLLPIENLSQTPMAGEKAESLMEIQLRKKGISQLSLYPGDTDDNLSLLLDDKRRVSQAHEWAKQQGFQYAVTGKIQEWRYKNGLDSEPSVGISLKIIDVSNDQVLWTASAAHTGWGHANLAGVASKTIDSLLDSVRVK